MFASSVTRFSKKKNGFQSTEDWNERFCPFSSSVVKNDFAFVNSWRLHSKTDFVTSYLFGQLKRTDFCANYDHRVWIRGHWGDWIGRVSRNPTKLMPEKSNAINHGGSFPRGDLREKVWIYIVDYSEFQVETTPRLWHSKTTTAAGTDRGVPKYICLEICFGVYACFIFRVRFLQLNRSFQIAPKRQKKNLYLFFVYFIVLRKAQTHISKWCKREKKYGSWGVFVVNDAPFSKL